jgi:hypothetical protein
MKINFFRPNIDSYHFQIILVIAKITIFEITIGQFYALNTNTKGFILTILGLTIQITED